MITLVTMALSIFIAVFLCGLLTIYCLYDHDQDALAVWAEEPTPTKVSLRQVKPQSAEGFCNRKVAMCCCCGPALSAPALICLWSVAVYTLLAMAYTGIAYSGSSTYFSHPNNYQCYTMAGHGAPTSLMDGTPFIGSVPSKWQAISYTYKDGASSLQLEVLANGLVFPADNWTSWVPGDWVDVEFDSRPSPLSGTRIKLRAWYTNASASAPLVILTHGHGECKAKYEVLIPANMLHRAGFSTLLLDYRNHGASDKSEGGKITWGVGEHLDILGAWDWARVKLGYSSENIGLFGPSMGGAAVSFAAANEPRVRSAFVDSPVCSPYDLYLNGVAKLYGGILSPIASAMTDSLFAISRRRTEYDVSRFPFQEMGRLGKGQNYAVVGTTGDLFTPPDMVLRCHDIAKASSQVNSTMLWMFDDETKYHATSTMRQRADFDTRWSSGSHVRLMMYEPREYEKRIISWFLGTLALRPNMTNWLPHARRLRKALVHWPERHRFNDGQQPDGDNPFAWMDALAARVQCRRRLASSSSWPQDGPHHDCPEDLPELRDIATAAA